MVFGRHIELKYVCRNGVSEKKRPSSSLLSCDSYNSVQEMPSISSALLITNRE